MSFKDKGEIGYMHFLEKLNHSMGKKMMANEMGHQRQDNTHLRLKYGYLEAIFGEMLPKS